MNGILALSEMLASSELPQRQQRYAGVISKSGKSLLSIINDILDFSKVEAGKMDMEAIETDLTEVAEDVASLFAAKAQDKALDLAVFVHPRTPRVLADPVRLRQVVGNLVNNAIKFTETGGVLIEIEPINDQVRIAIRDTGPGIPADRLPSLFEAFTQADQTTTRKFGGTGLGLAICDRLVRSMGGTWDVSSTVGQGSTFAFDAPFPAIELATAPPPFGSDWHVRLYQHTGPTAQAIERYLQAVGVGVDDGAEAGFTTPGELQLRLGAVICADDDEAARVLRADGNTCALVRPVRRSDLFSVLEQMHRGERPRLDEVLRSDDTGQSFPGVRVLVVDDQDVNREVASEALSRLGADVETANNGVEAVERLRIKTYDLVLMDGSMPDLDGYEATRRIREEETETGRPRAVIIALTAHVVGAGAQAWQECGMDGVIHKPFTLSDFVRELGRHCAVHAVTGRTAAPAPAPATDPDDLLDPVVRGELLTMKTSGRGDFVRKVHNLYADNAPARLDDLARAVQAGDQEAAARAAHALRSMSLSLGAAAVARAAGEIEQAAEAGGVASGDVDRIRNLLVETLAVFGEDVGPAPVAVTLHQELIDAMAAGQITLVYQPLVDRHGNFASKTEALVRWLHPVEGPRAPDTFIPRLEADGSIELLTDFVLARALSDMSVRPDLTVSVNVSAGEFQTPGFAERIHKAAQRADFPPARLEIEVTETAMLQVAAAARAIRDLKAFGFSVALDDFGAGFTSLHALRELPFDTLKIDRGFVERCSGDNASAAIIQAVIGVGRALGMKVVCEGVETGEQAEFLRVAGTHMMQGFYFHRPMAVRDLPAKTSQAA